MEEQYWKRFYETGKIEDYLFYRGLTICGQIMKRHKGDKRSESDYCDGNGNCGIPYGRI